jgi:hypothetical protein
MVASRAVVELANGISFSPFQTRMPVLADDDVVLHGDAEWGAKSLIIWMSACDGDWIAKGVIMHQDYRKMPASPNCIDSDDLSCNAKKFEEAFNGSLDSL